MNEQPDPILAALRDREAALLVELAAANQAVAVLTGRLDEIRDLISKMTDGRRRARKKAAEPARENGGGDLLETHHEPA
jgi:hypothetical protein